MNTRASRCAIWRLHAPPSRYERIQPQAKERTAKLPPNRVTFLNGPNRDFPKWRRHQNNQPIADDQSMLRRLFLVWPISSAAAFCRTAEALQHSMLAITMESRARLHSSRMGWPPSAVRRQG